MYIELEHFKPIFHFPHNLHPYLDEINDSLNNMLSDKYFSSSLDLSNLSEKEKYSYIVTTPFKYNYVSQEKMNEFLELLATSLSLKYEEKIKILLALETKDAFTFDKLLSILLDERQKFYTLYIKLVSIAN